MQTVPGSRGASTVWTKDHSTVSHQLPWSCFSMQNSPLGNEEKGEHLIHVLGQGQVMILDMKREECSTSIPQTPRRSSENSVYKKTTYKIIIFNLFFLIVFKLQRFFKMTFLF